MVKEKMNRTDYLYHYSKYFLATLSEIIICEENWNLEDADARYKEIVTSVEMIRNKISDLPNQAKQEKAIKELSDASIEKEKESFLDNFLKNLKKNNRYTVEQMTTLKTHIELELMGKPNIKILDFVKKIREFEIEDLQ